MVLYFPVRSTLQAAGCTTLHCTLLHHCTCFGGHSLVDYSCTLHYCTGLGWAGLIVLPSPFCNAHYTRLALDWHQTLVRECRSALSYKGCTALYCTALHWAHCPALPMVCHSFPLRHSTKDHYSHRRASKSPDHLKKWSEVPSQIQSKLH